MEVASSLSCTRSLREASSTWLYKKDVVSCTAWTAGRCHRLCTMNNCPKGHTRRKQAHRSLFCCGAVEKRIRGRGGVCQRMTGAQAIEALAGMAAAYGQQWLGRILALQPLPPGQWPDRFMMALQRRLPSTGLERTVPSRGKHGSLAQSREPASPARRARGDRS
jgi:hypothetical protein